MGILKNRNLKYPLTPIHVQMLNFQVHDWLDFIEKEGGIEEFSIHTFTDTFHDDVDFSHMKKNIFFRSRSYLHQIVEREMFNGKDRIVDGLDYETMICTKPNEIVLKTSRIIKEYDGDFALTVDIVFLPGADKYYIVGSLKRNWNLTHFKEFRKKHGYNLIKSFVPTKLCLYLYFNEPEIYNILCFSGFASEFEEPILTFDTFFHHFVPETSTESPNTSSEEDKLVPELSGDEIEWNDVFDFSD
jgi:hypothetical protein